MARSLEHMPCLSVWRLNQSMSLYDTNSQTNEQYTQMHIHAMNFNTFQTLPSASPAPLINATAT